MDSDLIVIDSDSDSDSEYTDIVVKRLSISDYILYCILIVGIKIDMPFLNSYI